MTEKINKNRKKIRNRKIFMYTHIHAQRLRQRHTDRAKEKASETDINKKM